MSDTCLSPEGLSHIKTLPELEPMALIGPELATMSLIGHKIPERNFLAQKPPCSFSGSFCKEKGFVMGPTGFGPVIFRTSSERHSQLDYGPREISSVIFFLFGNKNTFSFCKRKRVFLFRIKTRIQTPMQKKKNQQD